jgi:signal transduction histidine kinase
MTPLPSIRARLARALVATSVVSGLAVSAAVWFTVRSEADELLDSSLTASAAVLAGQLLAPAGAPGDTLADPALPALAPDEEFAWQLVDRDGAVRLRSASAPRVAFATGPTLGFVNIERWRVLGRATGVGGQVMYVAQARAERGEVAADIAFSGATAALVVAALGLAWLRRQVERELEPLEALSRAVAAFDPMRLDAPLGPAQRAEFVPVHAAIDALGQGLAQRVANEHAVTAHAAHALRTPLAGIDAQLAVALRECPPALRPRLAQAREAAGRLQRVVGSLLTLFRTGAELHRQPVDVAALLARLPIEALEVRVQAPALVDADPDLLAAALMNLLDNALRHGARRVVVSVDGSCVRLHDDGPGVAEERRLALQAAIDEQRYESPLGLGLTLADRVARAHGGALQLHAVAQGFDVALRLSTNAPPTPAPTVADSRLSSIEP